MAYPREGPKKLPGLARTGPTLGLKKGVKSGIFGLKYGKDLDNRAVHPHQEFPGVIPGPRELFSHFTYLTEETTSTLDVQCETFISMLQSVIRCRCSTV